MTASLWSESVGRALASLDPREPSLVLGIGQAPSTDSARERVEPSIWTDFVHPAVVVTQEHELSPALGNVMSNGPVLTELGFQRRFGSGREARDIELRTAKLLRNGAQMAGTGVLAIVMPASLATSTSGARVRETLALGLDLRHVIFGRGVLEGVHSQFEVACLVWSRGMPGAGEVCFLRLPRETDSRQQLANDQSMLLAHQVEQDQSGYWAPVDLGKGDSLAFDLRNPELLERQQQLAGLGRLTRLGSLFEILRSAPLGSRRPVGPEGPTDSSDDALRGQDRYCDPDVEGAVREVTGRDLIGGGLRGPNDDSRYRQTHPGDIFLSPGDLLVRNVVPPAGTLGARLVVAVYDGPPDQAVAGSSVLVLRPLDGTTSRDLTVASLFLQSEVAFRLLFARDGRVLQLLPRTLAELEVPMPDVATADAMVSIVDVRDSLREWLAEAEEVLSRLYVRADAVAAKQDVLDVSRTLRARVEQGHALDDPDERYRTTYAYPVAYRWRLVEAAYTGTDPEKTLREILQAAEVTLAYAACIGLVFARTHGVNLPCLKEVRNKLATGRSGMGFGDWANILNEATLSSEAKRVPADAALSEVRQFFTAEGLEPARARLKQLRDDQSHGRFPAGQELLEALEQSYADLLTLLEAAAPLSDLGLVFVDQARIDSLRGSTVVRYREFRGDHPVVPHREVLVEGTLFEEGSLYLRDTDNDWHLLRPYLLANQCPRCNAWSMFAIDRVKKSVPDYKSLDHGHTEERTDCLDALIQVGLVDAEVDPTS